MADNDNDDEMLAARLAEIEAESRDCVFRPASHDPGMTRHEARIAAARGRCCREWERIAGIPGRYRIQIENGRVRIAQFRAPEDYPTVEFGPGKDSRNIAESRRTRCPCRYGDTASRCVAGGPTWRLLIRARLSATWWIETSKRLES